MSVAHYRLRTNNNKHYHSDTQRLHLNLQSVKECLQMLEILGVGRLQNRLFNRFLVLPNLCKDNCCGKGQYQLRFKSLSNDWSTQCCRSVTSVKGTSKVYKEPLPKIELVSTQVRRCLCHLKIKLVHSTITAEPTAMRPCQVPPPIRTKGRSARQSCVASR